MAAVSKSNRGRSGIDIPAVSPELLTTILDTFDAVVYVADISSCKILFANRHLKELFGFDPTGRDYRHLIHTPDVRHLDFSNNEKLLGPDGKPGEELVCEYRNPFNKNWYAGKAKAIEWADGQLVRLEIGLDITEHRQLTFFLDEARMQASSAISAKNRFVALVAHDLKSPFVSILGMINRILKKETFEYEVHKRFLENIISNGQRMLKMIDNLLDMDRLETGKIRPSSSYFDASELVDDVFENFAHLAAKKGVKLENFIPRGTEFYADKYLYFVVLNNLVSNSVKFSFKGGKVEVGYKATRGMDRVVVRDYGGGIPAEYQDDIFKPDVKTTSKGTSGEAGSGLGLVFCQQIMHAHGGKITFSCDEEEGAVFYVDLASTCRFPQSPPGSSEDSELF